MAALALAVSTVFAAPTIGPGKTVEETPGMPRTDPVDRDLYNFSTTTCTGFEVSEGWDLDFSICGAAFAFGGTCAPGGYVCQAPSTNPGAPCLSAADCTGVGANCGYGVTNVCLPKNNAASQNCCPEDPNVNTGWSMSPSSRHCVEPSIRNINPSNLKDPFNGKTSLQHVRFQHDDFGGLPAGCVGMASACRERFITSQAHVAEVSQAQAKYDIAISGLLGMNLVQFWGQDTSAGSINLNTYTYWYYLGGIYIYSHTAQAFAFGGYWAPGRYVQYEVDLNPCTNVATYSYDGVVVFQEAYGFSPPYGDQVPDLRAATSDTSFFTTDSYAPETIDIDNYCVVQKPCSDACCGKDGVCVDGVAEGDCTGAWYPNVLCANLGTAGYPPVCALRQGSCCNAGPRAGGPGAEGSCTDGVLLADCPPIGEDPRWYTWNQGGSCSAVAGICHTTTLAASLCDAVDGTPNCTNWPNVGKPCPNGPSDCTVEGFCYAGTCTPPALSGHCVYPSAGYCQGMGSCIGEPACVPTTGAGCCDNGCSPPVLCPSGVPGDCVGKAPCNAVPGGADCAFCEGCNAFATVLCATVADCPPPFPGLLGGIDCVPNVPAGCNLDDDCPTGQTPCIIPKVNSAGTLCLSNADCLIAATVCGPEHKGACCHGTTGLCDDDVLEADCKADQDLWTKLTDCATAGCIRHTGACVDCSPGAGGPGPECGCRNGTYPEDCVGAQETWVKGSLCSAIIGQYTESLGACCEYVKGTCENDVLQADCVGDQETWFEKELCADVELRGACDPDLGACCDHDTFGGCTETTFNGCQGPKLEFTKGALCVNIDCLHEAIPTVSEWGLVVLTLLLLVGAKVYFGRRQNATA
jgi:hypothetical protein